MIYPTEIHSLIHLRSTTFGCEDLGIRKSQFRVDDDDDDDDEVGVLNILKHIFRTGLAFFRSIDIKDLDISKQYLKHLGFMSLGFFF